MTFDLKILLGGAGAIFACGIIFWMGLQKGMNYPAGLYAGPLAIVLGVILLCFAIRGIAKGE